MTRPDAEPRLLQVDFVDAGRAFTCTAAPRSPSDTSVWWWFQVSGDDRNRYAPFLASGEDTEMSVRARVVEYYDNLLARRAAPYVPYWQRQRPA